jgi:putative transposase
MRHVNGLYTQRFNRSLKRDGALFRGRYKAIVVGKDNYLLQVSRYIHLNPIEARLCKEPQYYEWSSYSYYVEPRKKPDWLETDKILSMLSKK